LSEKMTKNELFKKSEIEKKDR
jgi:hypothetical protein